MRRAERVVDVERRCRRSAVATNAGSLPSSPGSKRRFSSSSTPGASSASRARTGVHRVLGVGLALRSAEVADADTTVAPRAVSHSIVGSAARIRKSSVIAAARRAAR